MRFHVEISPLDIYSGKRSYGFILVRSTSKFYCALEAYSIGANTTVIQPLVIVGKESRPHLDTKTIKNQTSKTPTLLGSSLN